VGRDIMQKDSNDEYKIIEDAINQQPKPIIERSVRRAFVVFKNGPTEAFGFEKYINVSIMQGQIKYKEGHTGELAYTNDNIVQSTIDDRGFHKIMTCIVEEDFAPKIKLNNFLNLAKTNMTSLVDNRYDIYPEIIVQRDDDNELLLSARIVEEFLFRKVTVDVVDKVCKAYLEDMAEQNENDYSLALKLK